MTFSVCIPTIGTDRIRKLARLLPPPMQGVEYVVSWQEHEDTEIPESMQRPDVTVTRFEGKGVSANRNNAIENATGEIVLNADDDIGFVAENYHKVVTAFEKDQTLTVALLKCERRGGPKYPKGETVIKKLPKGYWTGAPEIAFKKDSGLRFDERFGTASGCLEAAEDEKFVYDARKKGFTCCFYPVVIARHEGESTGTRPIANPKALQASGKMIRLEFPLTWMLRIPLKAFRLKRSGRSSFATSLREMWKGATES